MSSLTVSSTRRASLPASWSLSSLSNGRWESTFSIRLLGLRKDLARACGGRSRDRSVRETSRRPISILELGPVFANYLSENQRLEMKHGHNGREVRTADGRYLFRQTNVAPMRPRRAARSRRGRKAVEDLRPPRIGSFCGARSKLQL